MIALNVIFVWWWRQREYGGSYGGTQGVNYRIILLLFITNWNRKKISVKITFSYDNTQKALLLFLRIINGFLLSSLDGSS